MSLLSRIHFLIVAGLKVLNCFYIFLPLGDKLWKTCTTRCCNGKYINKLISDCAIDALFTLSPDKIRLFLFTNISVNMNTLGQIQTF